MPGFSGITAPGVSRNLRPRISLPLTSNRCSRQVFLIIALLVWETILLFSFLSVLKCKLRHLSRNQCIHHINKRRHRSILWRLNSARSRRLRLNNSNSSRRFSSPRPRNIHRVHSSSHFRCVQRGSVHDQMKRKLHPPLPSACLHSKSAVISMAAGSPFRSLKTLSILGEMPRMTLLSERVVSSPASTCRYYVKAINLF